MRIRPWVIVLALGLAACAPTPPAFHLLNVTWSSSEGTGPPGTMPYLGTTDRLELANTEVQWPMRRAGWTVDEVKGEAKYEGKDADGEPWEVQFSWTPPPAVIPPKGFLFDYIVALTARSAKVGQGRLAVAVDGMKPDGHPKPMFVGRGGYDDDAHGVFTIAPKVGAIVGHKAWLTLSLNAEVFVIYKFEYRTPARPPNP